MFQNEKKGVTNWRWIYNEREVKISEVVISSGNDQDQQLVEKVMRKNEKLCHTYQATENKNEGYQCL